MIFLKYKYSISINDSLSIFLSKTYKHEANNQSPCKCSIITKQTNPTSQLPFYLAIVLKFKPNF